MPNQAKILSPFKLTPSPASIPQNQPLQEKLKANHHMDILKLKTKAKARAEDKTSGLVYMRIPAADLLKLIEIAELAKLVPDLAREGIGVADEYYEMEDALVKLLNQI